MTRATLTALLGLVAGLAFQGAFRLADIAALCAVVAAASALAVTAAGRLAVRPARSSGTGPAGRPGPAGTIRTLPYLALVAGTGLLGWLLVVPGAALLFGDPAAGPAGRGFPLVLLDAIGDGPRRLLTTLPPAPATPELLALLGTLVWWAVFASAAAAAAGVQPLLTVLPQVVVALLGCAASAAVGDPHAVPVAVGFGIIAVLLLWVLQSRRGLVEEARAGIDGGVAPPSRSRFGKGRGRGPAGVPGPAGAAGRVGAVGLTRSGGTGGRRSALGAAPAVSALAVVALAAAVVGPRLPGLADRKPWDPRTRLAPPSVMAADQDPLSQAVAWMNAKTSKALFSERGVPADTPQRLIVLDQYDGRRWTSSAGYTWAGTALPKPSAEQVPPQTAVRSVSEDVRVTALAGPWLPVPGAARAVTPVAGGQLRVDPVLGQLAAGTDADPADAAGTVADPTAALAGFEYRVDAEIPVVPDAGRLAEAPAGSGGSLDAERALPAGMPDPVTKWVSDATSGLDPWEQLQHLSQTIRSSFEYDDRMAPGPNLGRLKWLVGYAAQAKAKAADAANQNGAATAVKPVGTSPDVAATLFAMAARQAGFPSRLVVGFVGKAGAAADADGRIDVADTDARIWPEAYFKGIGWVPFLDAVPVRGGEKDAGTPAPKVVPTGPTTSAEATQQSSQGAFVQPPVVQGTSSAAGGGGAWSGAALWGGVAGLLLLAGLAGLGAGVLVPRWRARQLRERRRGAGADVRQRVVWAWEDGLASLAAVRVVEGAVEGVGGGGRDGRGSGRGGAGGAKSGGTASRGGLRSRSRAVAVRRRELGRMTPREIAAVAGQRWGADIGGSVVVLAGLAETAVYSGEWMVDGAGDRAWECADAVRRVGKRRH